MTTAVKSAVTIPAPADRERSTSAAAGDDEPVLKKMSGVVC